MGVWCTCNSELRTITDRFSSAAPETIGEALPARHVQRLCSVLWAGSTVMDKERKHNTPL